MVELTITSKLILVLFLCQTGLLILNNWIIKSIKLIKTDIKKFFGIIFFSTIKYFYCCYSLSDMEFKEIIDNSIIWIPLLSLIIIDFCIPTGY